MTDSEPPIASLPRIAAIATMASRVQSFERAFPAIHAQVDHVYVYLDGYSAIPAFLEDRERISVFHAQDVGDLHASSRFLCLQQLSVPTVVFMMDDDIIYPLDYADRMIQALQQCGGRAIVGVLGRIFLPPHVSYVHHVATMHFERPVERIVNVHELGTGTCAFVSANFDVDPRSWDRTDMDDITVAIEAQKRRLPGSLWRVRRGGSRQSPRIKRTVCGSTRNATTRSRAGACARF